jgi:hypothetical protein
MDNVHDLWLQACWFLLSMAANSCVNPVHKLLFPSIDSLLSLLSLVTFAPGILNALQAVTPPEIAIFKALPTISRGDERI